MSEANFTKSNWTLHRVNHDMTVKGELHVVASDGYPSAFVPSWNNDNETALEAMANAHLIAAAPEMYGVIAMLLDSSSFNTSYPHESEFMESLLAKARGES